MLLSRLAASLEAGGFAVAAGSAAGSAADPEITSVVFDSRSAGPGALFACLRGADDGHRFAPGAKEAGAAALLVDRTLDVDLPQLVVDDTRAALGAVAAAFWDHPSRRLAVVGVTGTNGKTTVTHFLAAIMAAARRPTEVVGTLSQARTTPEAPDLQALLAGAAERGAEAVALEVSSHALAQMRVAGTWFTVAVFTNLTQDHLDFHHSMEEYFAAKASLFSPDVTGMAVVNVGDAYGRRLAELARQRGLAVRTYSLADATDLAFGRDGSTFVWSGVQVAVRLPGRHNVANALAAATVASELGVDPTTVAAGLGTVDSVPGRFELVDAGQPFTIVVDYAHTPAALRETLAAARILADAGGRVTVVFGCGGERDHEKRPQMGEVATRLADMTVLTSDNPRSEDPLAILAEVVAGADPARSMIEVDRRLAIARALAESAAGDVVVIAGKGHEVTQQLASGPVVFDDRVVAAAEWKRISG